jgi:hypothetical protein
MRFEVVNGDDVGTVEWRGPGDVAVNMTDPSQERWFTRYFQAEESVMRGPVDCAEMTSERRDASEESFQRAAFQLAAYAYRVRTKAESSARSAFRQRPNR